MEPRPPHPPSSQSPWGPPEGVVAFTVTCFRVSPAVPPARPWVSCGQRPQPSSREPQRLAFADHGGWSVRREPASIEGSSAKAQPDTCGWRLIPRKWLTPLGLDGSRGTLSRTNPDWRGSRAGWLSSGTTSPTRANISFPERLQSRQKDILRRGYIR